MNPERSLVRLHPEIAAEALDWDPSQVSAGSRALRPWRCASCSTIWTAEVRARARGQRDCPACARASRPSLAVTHPALAAQMLAPFDPAAYTHGSKAKVWWRGPLGHEWEAAIANRVKGSGCPICARGAGARARQRPEPGHSLADEHPLLGAEAAGWRAADVRPGSNQRKPWRCSACGHEWEATVFHRVHGHGCPACARERRSVRTHAQLQGPITTTLKDES